MNRSSAVRNPQSPWSLTARWVFPVDGPPLERGVVVVEGERIAAVEPRGRRTADVDLGNIAILPGLVNAHTHLDLSGMRGKCPPGADFTEWLRGVIGYRRRQTPEQTEADIRAGLAESLQLGVTLLGDIASDGASWNALVTSEIRAVVFYELLGLSRSRAETAIQRGFEWLSSDTRCPTDTCRPALSPHAPYSVHSWLFQQASSLTNCYDVPCATHLAEDRGELQLLRERAGPFVDFLKEVGAWDEGGLAHSPEEVIESCLGAEPLLWIHGNYLPPAVELDPYTNPTIIYCPRTHAAFGHPPHPFREFLARGVRVALGTDSLASNPDLDILAEARFVHAKHPDVPGTTLLRMVTLSGSEALGWDDETGSLTPGKSADLVVLPLPDEERADPHDLVLETSLPVQKTLFRGQWRA